MKQLVFRVTDNSQDIELLTYDQTTKKEFFSAIKANELLRKLQDLMGNNASRREDLVFLNESIIAIGSNCSIVKQDGHTRIVTYAGKAYNINFPNSLYLIDHTGSKIIDIEAYCYKKYNGLETELFEYAMPNMLTGSRICIGSAPKEIVDHDIVAALEKIIFTQYTHGHVDNIKSFRDTSEYFQYLTENPYPYELLISTGTKLKDIMK